MPLEFDMSLDELYAYQGINPRPSDFDTFWNNGVAEMHALDPQIDLQPAQFQAPFADCYDMTFTGVGGARIYAKLAHPKGPSINTPHPAVIFYHGYTMNSGDWVKMLPYVAAGFTIAALDCRGQGGRSEDAGGVIGNTLNGHIVRGLSDSLEGRPEKLLFRQIFLDVAQIAKILMEMPEVDESRVGVTGGSQGGALTVVAAALEPRIKIAAPVFPFLSDYLRVWEMDLAKDAYGELRSWFRRFDPQHKRHNDVFTQLGYIDIQHLAGRIQAEVEWYVGLADEICPPSTQFAAYNKITSAKSLQIFHDFAHEGPPGHLDMIFQTMMKL